MKVSGYIRSRSLSANALVHLPGFGDFQISQIDAPDDPYPLCPRANGGQKKTEDAMVKSL